MEKIVIAIDTMGTDNGSAYFVQGIAEAMDLYDDLSFIVTGKEEELKCHFCNKAYKFTKEDIGKLLEEKEKSIADEVSKEMKKAEEKEKEEKQ